MALTKQDLQSIASLLEAGFKPIEQRLGGLEMRLGSLELRFEQFSNQIDAMNEGITDALNGYHDTKTYNHRLAMIETEQGLQRRVLKAHSQQLAKLPPTS